MRKHDALQGACGEATETEGDLLTADRTSLGATRVAVHVDPGIRGASFCGGIGLDEDRAHGVLPGDTLHDGGVRLEGASFLVVDGKVDERGTGLVVAALLPESAEFLLDAADRHRNAGDEAHRRLQVTPWRAASSAASAGPQDPAS